MDSFPPPRELRRASHYHQAHGIHPGAYTIPPDHELVEVVTGGHGWVEHEGQWFEVGPGALVWHMPGDRTIARSDFADPYRCLAVLFSGPLPPGRRVPRFSNWPELDELRAFTREVVRTVVDESFDRQAILAYTFGRLYYQARRSHHRAWSPDLPPNLRKVLKSLYVNFALPLTLADLAEQAGWSVPHLHAVFKQHLGSSPHQYLARRRLQAAREYLVATDRPIKRIAADCGYNRDAAFCRQFRQATGLTPAAYRRRHQPAVP